MSGIASTLPQHIGLIIDGNRRWAKEQGLPTLEGHSKGRENVKEIGEYLLKRGVKYVSVYAFSTENWKRTQEEVNYLMDLVLFTVREDLDEFHERNIRVRCLGAREGMREDVLEAIDTAEAKTAGNTGGTLAFCLNYGGQLEIATAVRAALAAGVKPTELNEKDIAKHLWAPDIPDVDLIIRTSGEQRLSNFMLWRAAYAELYFFEKHWPALIPEDLDEALEWYAGRERRFGGDSQK